MFEWPETSPNFITQKQVTAPAIGCNARERLAGAIVCIPNADPGFDWLFAYPIAGLITAWGGANSHMAIRAGELGLPAVIGAGEVNYQRWSHADRLHVDCAGRRVEVLA
jgi:phosphohistidine swiveling domain-containing protein